MGLRQLREAEVRHGDQLIFVPAIPGAADRLPGIAP